MQSNLKDVCLHASMSLRSYACARRCNRCMHAVCECQCEFVKCVCVCDKDGGTRNPQTERISRGEYSHASRPNKTPPEGGRLVQSVRISMTRQAPCQGRMPGVPSDYRGTSPPHGGDFPLGRPSSSSFERPMQLTPMRLPGTLSPPRGSMSRSAASSSSLERPA